jgi:hypothetical protein
VACKRHSGVRCWHGLRKADQPELKQWLAITAYRFVTACAWGLGLLLAFEKLAALPYLQPLNTLLLLAVLVVEHRARALM